jgi:hypothetical protein
MLFNNRSSFAREQYPAVLFRAPDGAAGCPLIQQIAALDLDAIAYVAPVPVARLKKGALPRPFRP